MNQGGSSRNRKAATSQPSVIDEAWLIGVAEGASKDSGGVSTEFLAGYLPMLADAATIGRAPKRAEIDAVRLQGRKAAESGVPVGRGVDLYLSAARRVWDELPAVIRQRDNRAVRAAAEALLQVVDEAVASFADGHAEAGRELIRKEETLRRDLVDDLLRGDAHLSELVGRAEPFGLDLTRAHQVALAQPGQRLPSIAAATSALERVVLDRFGDRDVLVATKEGLVVVIALADGDRSAGHLDGPGDDRQPRQDRAQRAQPPAAWVSLAGRDRSSAPGCLRDRPLLRGGPRRTDHGGPDAPRQPDRRDTRPADLPGARPGPTRADRPRLLRSAPARQARGGAGPLVETLAATSTAAAWRPQPRPGSTSRCGP